MGDTTPKQRKMLTFKELCQLEPGLLLLLKEAKEKHSELKTYGGRNQYWYSVLKGEMSRLVGFGSDHPDTRLHTSAVYDVCYNELCHALTGEWLRQPVVIKMSVKGDLLHMKKTRARARDG